MELYRFDIHWTYYGEPRVTTYIKPIRWEMGLAALWQWASSGMYGNSDARIDVSIVPAT